MYEQENQRATHLLILSVYTILTIMLTAESLLLGWDTGAIILLLLGVIISWGAHITEKIPEPIRLWMYFALTMLAFFFYGTHNTSIYDMAPLMILLIIMYSVTENHMVIRLCVLTYFLTMLYDLIFVQGASIELDSLVISRTLLHLVLVYMAGRLVRIVIHRRVREKKIMDGRIAELEEANRRTEDFLTNVSHELRTPINAVTGITAVMLKREEDEIKRRDIFAVQKAGHRLFDQIEDILDFTEIDTGRIKVSEESYMLSSIVNDIINGIKLADRENMPELIFDVDAGIPSLLLGDGRKIKKILKHLIDNSAKFTKRGGIYVRIYALNKPYGINLCIGVSDTGVGIENDELERITESFYQSDRGRNRRAGGLGLGLPIVYGMVNAMEGFMRIESTVGEGTTVYVSIPQKVADAAPGIVVENKDSLCLACFLRPEKYEIPEVRNYYNQMISNMVKQLDVPLHRVSDMEELERLNSRYRLTHLFIGREEYEDNQSYFVNLSQSMEVIVVADDSFVLPQDSRLKILRKPLYCLPLTNILNAGASEAGDVLNEKHMVCPGVRVLVVDDEPMNLMVAEGIFGSYDMKVRTAESGRAAIKLCEEEDFDLIFLDHMMPEMDGVETLKQLRKNHADSSKVLTVIAFTANAVSGAREMFLSEGFDEFISKPVERMELERVLRKVLPKASVKYVDEKHPNVRKTETADNIPEAATEDRIEQNTDKDRILQLEASGFNTGSGMQYCGGEREFYEEMLIKFARDAAGKERDIQDFFTQEDLDNYSIRVHSLKSTARIIGADSLSEKARIAEQAAKEHNSDYIKEHHGELLSEYHEVVQHIVEVFALKFDDSAMNNDGERIEISTAELLDCLKEIKENLAAFETDKVEDIIREMSGVVHKGASVREFLDGVRQDVEEFEIEAASGKIEALIKDLEGGEAL